MSQEFYISSTGNDLNSGTFEKPFATLFKAQQAVRESSQFRKSPIKVQIKQGTYYLPKTLVFTAADSGTKTAPVTFRAYKNGKVIISGGMELNLEWEIFRDGVFQAAVPKGVTIDQIFVDGKRQHMARYPSYNANIVPYNSFAADAFSPERASRWSNPKGGYIHAMHSAHWGGYHYKITGKDSNNKISYIGGWQNNRQMGMHDEYRFVENIFEELDAPGEWFYDADKQTVYFYPPKDINLKNAKIEIVRLHHLIEFKGSGKSPVKFVDFNGFTFRHASRTFMDTKEPLLRSDWTIYRGGAVVFDGAEDCSISNCEFDQLGGNSIFVNKYNRRITIRACHIHDSGASGICFIGDPKAVRNPLFEYHQTNSYDKIDKIPGPKTDNYPADCLVDDCLINGIGIVEKQAAGVQISMAKGITIRHCSIYDVGRAGININEGTFGGHIIEFCDVFDTVRETGDHGSFNSWGRDRFWHLRGAPEEKLPELALLDVEKNIIRNSRWRCDNGWDVDLDDGSSNYEIYNNLFLRGGLKLREGFHRKVYNNIAINNSLHPHVWYNNSQDVITGNIWMVAYRPAGGMPKGKWGEMVDRNLFTQDSYLKSYSKHGCDSNSISGNPMFIDPAKGDFRVKKDSPAFRIGFKNFPMDRFGVQNTKLKAIAQTPQIPKLADIDSMPVAKVKVFYWQGATVKPIGEEEFSAFGVSKDDGGLHLVNIPKDSVLEKAGLKSGDLIQAINKCPVQTMDDFQKITNSEAGKALTIDFVRNQAKSQVTLSKHAYAVIKQ